MVTGLTAYLLTAPLTFGQGATTLDPWRAVTEQRYYGPMDENLGTLRPTLTHGRGSGGLGVYNAGLNPASLDVFGRMRRVYVPTEENLRAIHAVTEMRAYSDSLPLGWVSRDQGTNWTRFVVRDARSGNPFPGLINLVYYAQHEGLYLFQTYPDKTWTREELYISPDGENLSPLPENPPWNCATVSWDGRIICNPRAPFYWKSQDESAPTQFMEYQPESGAWATVHDFADTPQPKDYVFMNCYGDYLFRFNHLRRRISIARRDHSAVVEDVMIREGSYVVHDDGTRLSLLALFGPNRYPSGNGDTVFQSLSFAASPNLDAPLWPRSPSTPSNPGASSNAVPSSYITLNAVVWVRGASNDVYSIESSPFSEGPWQLEERIRITSPDPVPWTDRRDYLKEGRRFYRTQKLPR